MLQFDEHYAIGGYSALLRKVSWDLLDLSVHNMLNYGNAWEIGKYLYITNGIHDGMGIRNHSLQPSI